MAGSEQQSSRGAQATPSTFGRLVKRLRIAADLTQEELAERASVSARLISDLERGLIQRSRRDTVEMLADGLGLSGTERATFIAIARRRPRLAPEPDAALDQAAPLSNLPRPLTGLLGREREVSATTGLLIKPETRLLTLTGPGGVGKTRLAIEIAERVAAAFPGGVSFVDLAPVGHHRLVIPTMARALELAGDVEIQTADELARLLPDNRLLLLLDNLEHLIDAAPELARLLESSPQLVILATSREPLRLRAEREYPVGPLTLPSLDARTSFQELESSPAVSLFVRAAEAARPQFALSAGNARAVAEITVRLDGLPLAIELAAARMRVLTPAELLERLEQRLPLLTGGARDLPARQRTLREAIGWSYALLDQAEQRLFRQLSVFTGGFTLDAAEFISADGDPTATLDGLTSLVDKNLVRALDERDLEGETGRSRFGMFETIREFGLEQLEAAGEHDALRRRHAEWCIDLANRAEGELSGPQQAAWLARMLAETDNLRAALAWSVEQHDADLGLRLVGPLLRFWVTAGMLAEARGWYERVLALDAPPLSADRAKALLGVEVVAYFQGDCDAARTYGQEALEIYQALGDRSGMARSYGNLGLIGDALEDYDLANELYGRALEIFREIGDRLHTGFMLGNLGLIAYFQGEYERATTLLEEALVINRERGDNISIAITLSNLGLVVFAQGDLDRAAALQTEALKIRRLAPHAGMLARSFDNFAVIAAARGEYERAVRLFAAAEAVRAEVGSAQQSNDREFNRPYIERAEAHLGSARFTALWVEGATMPAEEAIALALNESERVPSEAPRSSHQYSN